MTWVRKYKALETALGYRFKSEPLLERALTHASVRGGGKGRRTDNERLEFWRPRARARHRRGSRRRIRPPAGRPARGYNRSVR
jgi:ribonuclease-3